MINIVEIPKIESRPHVVAMIHVHSTTALLNHSYTKSLGIQSPSAADFDAVRSAIRKLQVLLEEENDPLILQVTPLSKFRSVVFLDPRSENILDDFARIPFVEQLIVRAKNEAAIFHKHGIRCVEVENVGAPYFVGSGACPWEELLIVHSVTRALRQQFADLAIGAHVLSCNELEALPIAIVNGCFFIRSESTLFTGVRPEGQTDNHSNLARFFYLRNVLRKRFQKSEIDQSEYPLLWTDIKKKHTVFMQELENIDVWLHNIVFAKLEGVIVTGVETGSNVDENSLKKSREEIDKVKQWNLRQYGQTPLIPLVTGSGLDFEMYSKYADFMIIGTALKVGGYWENDVDEAAVASVVERVRVNAH